MVGASLQARHCATAPGWAGCTFCCKICASDKSATFAGVACDVRGLRPWWEAQTSLLLTCAGAELHAVACGGGCRCAVAAGQSHRSSAQGT